MGFLSALNVKATKDQFSKSILVVPLCTGEILRRYDQLFVRARFRD